MATKSIFFDLDGTLTDSGEGIMNCAKLALEHYGIEVPDINALRVFVGPPLLDSFVKFGVPAEEAMNAVQIYRSRYLTIGKFENFPYPGIEALLQKLKADGHKLYVATSKPETTSIEILEHFDLAKYFDIICGATMGTNRSSKAAVIEYLLSKTGKSDEIIMVGDTAYDVIGAKAHNIPTIGVSWGYGEVSDIEAAGAAAIAHTMDELYAHLRYGGHIMNLDEAVLHYRDQIIESVQENVRIPSVQGEAKPGAPFGEGVRRSLRHALNTAETLGFRVASLDNYIGWAEYGEGDEMVAVLGHLDVVPEGDGWSCDPYGGIIRDGKIMGRGTTDDKGPSIAALYAMAALRDSGLSIRRRIRVLLGCNEETGSADINYYLSHNGEIPVMGFTPDGEYPVINGEKGIITACFKTNFRQSADLQLLSIQGGTAPNVVPGYASAEFSCTAETAKEITGIPQPNIQFSETEKGFRMEAFGLSAHGSTPELGENAIGRLLIAMTALPLSEELAQKIHFLAERIGMETDGTSAGISLQDAVSGKLSLNLGRIDSDGDSMTLWINYRYPVTFSYADCGPKFNALFTNAGFEILREGYKDKLYIPEDSELVTKLMKVYREQTGRMELPKCIGGGTYAKSIPNLLAFGPIFPGDELCEHKPDEYITIDSLIKNTQIIAHAMYELAK